MKRSFALLCLLALAVVLRAQPDISHIQLDNRIYANGIRSVTLSAGYLQDKPIISLGGGEITLNFDDLEETSRYVKYTIIHCTHDWQLSDINPID